MYTTLRGGIMKPSKFTYKHYHIPITYIGMKYSDLNVSKVKADKIATSVSKAPIKGLLVIKGSAGPIINQLCEDGRSIRGIDFTDRSNTAFEKHNNPEAAVVLIHSIGAEVTTNYNISRQVLQALLKFYSRRQTLVVLETSFGKSELRSNYDLTPNNYIILDEKEEEAWV